MAHVHVIGTGTIGAPVIRLLAERGDALDVDRVTFARRTAKPQDLPLLNALQDAGGEAAPPKASVDAFAQAGLTVTGTHEDVLKQADVVIEATPGGVAMGNKEAYTKMRGPKLFAAQGSEEGFGVPYALGVNDRALDDLDDRFVQVVSCNTHAISGVIRAIRSPGWALDKGRLVCIRRITDVGQQGKGEPAPALSAHSDPEGTHHAHDVARVFKTLGEDLDVMSSAIKVPTTFMHTLWFNLQLDHEPTLDEVRDAFSEDPWLATTEKMVSNTVFNQGREFGYHGRNLAQAVVALPSLFVQGNEVSGFAYTPQDGNVILTNLAVIARGIDPDGWRDRLSAFDDLLMRRV